MKTTGETERLMSLDALRGADMIFIMGFSTVVVAACNLLGFGKDCWLAAQMEHVPWHGLRHHDTIFPLFLFLAGMLMTTGKKRPHVTEADLENIDKIQTP